MLDRDVAFALIKTENLDEDARKRVTREAQAMGKLGDHPNIVTIHDMGEHEGQPYIVLPLMSGGDVEGLIEKAPEHRLPLEQIISIAKCVCNGLDFAHSKGIIHRDLKPGNVWLTADGSARIGDFGLAMVADISRLTQEGMMVGTVSYMPPEQAMGGEVSNKADLYSLGAMLYEMVTGRPPFVGDDSVAIIGQHINTPPVSPTWHRADLPPALEVLILLLLEKDPKKRPASVKDVLQAFESIEAGTAKTEPSAETTTPTENPLYRRVFVGREPELKQLQSAFDGAISGQGALMMVVGEPGIGKTAICEQLSTYVTLRGGKTLVGHCYEEGSLSLPYLAFVEAMRSYVLDRDVEDLRKELGSGATDVARIVSEIREKLKVKPRTAENPEEERYRLMQAVTSFLANAAKVKPMLVILEDLHDADKGTLEMLTYVSRNLERTRLLVVGTYRDFEVDRTHPLSAALAELRRVSTYGRVLLRGLNADEVRRMLASITGQDVPLGLADAVHRQTEGNPLFVQEVVRYLAEQKLLVRAGGRWQATGQTPLEMSIPEGLRDVIGKRLSSLSQECNRLLSIAAVVGREFRLDVLERVAGSTEEEVFAALEEARGAAVVEERSAVGAAVTYRFAHAFFRQTLYEEIIAPRRIRLHRQVAQALEVVYATRLQEHAAELAEHFSYSPELSDLGKAVSYGEMAAQRASDVYDYGEAARLLEQAIKVQDVLDPEDKGKVCDLLLALGEARMWGGEPSHSLDVESPAALSLAESIGDKKRIARACYLAFYSISSSGTVAAIAGPEGAQWLETAERYAEPGTLEHAYADNMKGIRSCLRGSNAEGVPLLRQAREQAKTYGDTQLMLWTNAWLSLFGITPWSAGEALQIAEELASMYVTGIDTGTKNAFNAFLTCGKRRQMEEMSRVVKDRASRTGQVNNVAISMALDASVAFLDGNLEQAVEILERLIALVQETDVQAFNFSDVMFAGLRPVLCLGNTGEYRDRPLWRVVEEQMSTPSFRYVPLYLAHQGRKDEVNERLERMLERRPDITSRDDLTHAWLDIPYLEAAVLVGHRKAAELLLERFKDNTLATTGYWWTTCVARHLGGAAALLERYDEAREHYKESLRVATEMKFRPELALTRLQLAELLLEHYPDEKKEALEHLDFAIKEFREMKMQPSLERALRHKEILGA